MAAKDVGAITDNFLGNSSIQGYPHLRSKDRGFFRKYLWLLCLLWLFALGFTLVHYIGVEYRNSYVMQRKVEVDKVAEFPGITICNLAPIPRSGDTQDELGWIYYLEQVFTPPRCDLHGIRSKRSVGSANSTAEKKAKIKKETGPLMGTYEITSGLQMAKGLIPAGRFNDICMPWHFKCGNGKCLDQRQQCDGVHDCDDDERDCVKCNDGTKLCPGNVCAPNGVTCPKTAHTKKKGKSCNPSEFECADSTCIKKKKRCDGIQDCQDDEINCDSCRGFLCNDGTCLQDSKSCDGHFDCDGGEDEAFDICGSNNDGDNDDDDDDKDGGNDDNNGDDDDDKDNGNDDNDCPSGHFHCLDNTCIPYYLVCDGNADCDDEWDETICFLDPTYEAEKYKCKDDEFTCDSNKCINNMYRCDGETDCVDAEDEKNCDSCKGNATLCSNGRCINSLTTCEIIANKGTTIIVFHPCPKGYFECANGENYNPRFKCDGLPHCFGEDDEDDCDEPVNLYPVVHDMRLKCSQYYSRIVAINGISTKPTMDVGECFPLHEGESDAKRTLMEPNENVDNDENSTEPTNGDEDEDLPIEDNGVYPEFVKFSVICQMPVVCDFYGCYDTQLRVYSEYTTENNIICSTCGGGPEVCWASQWLNGLSDDIMKPTFMLLSFIRGSVDMGQVRNLYHHTTADLEDHAIPADELLIDCRFNDKACDSRSLYTWIARDYGMCYTFNSQWSEESEEIGDWPKKTYYLGPKHGLHLDLNIRSGLSLLSPKEGLRVIVHDPNVLPVPQAEGYDLGTGSYSIKISKVETKRWDTSQKQCKHGFENDIPYDVYTYPICQALCLENALINHCNCSMGTSPTFDHLRPVEECDFSNLAEDLCVQYVENKYSRGDINCNCPQACREMDYKSLVTSTSMQEVYFNIFHEAKMPITSLCYPDTELVSLEVYLDSKEREVYEEKASKSFTSLMANLGGILFLFLGLSFIGMLEILEYFLVLIKYGITGKPTADSINADIPMGNLPKP